MTTKPGPNSRDTGLFLCFFGLRVWGAPSNLCPRSDRAPRLAGVRVWSKSKKCGRVGVYYGISSTAAQCRHTRYEADGNI